MALVNNKNMKNINEVSNKGIMWVNVTKQAEPELGQIQKRFGFLKDDIVESLPPFQRPKIVKRAGYYFMVLHFPVFDRESRRLGYTEVDFYLSQNYLVTVHSNRLPVIESFFNECLKNAEAKAKYFNGSAVHMLFELLNRLLDAVFPILLHVNDDINLVDRKLFTRVNGREIAEEILRLKTNIVTFRRTMQGHKIVLDRLVMYSGHELNIGIYQSYINDLREYSAEIWQMLESQKESIYALHETNESLLSLRTGEIMKILTIISVITFPLTTLATILAIRANNTPFVSWPAGFYIILGLALIGAGIMAMVFKKKKWL